MPTYDYVCDGCNHQFEQWQSFKEQTLKQCPECKQDSLRRLFGCAFVFAKGAPKTLQQQAELNSKTMGREECQERELRNEERRATALKAQGKRVPTGEKPWWRNGEIPGLIDSDKALTPAQVDKYKNELSAMGCNVNMNAEKDGKKNVGKE